MSIISNISQSRIYALIISFSLIFTEFYFFNWKTQFFVSNGYLIFNTLILFFFSFFLFYFLYLIYSKLNLLVSEKIIKIIDTLIVTLVLFKLIQIPFFLANEIDFKTLIAIFFGKILSGNLLFLVSFLKILFPLFIIFIILIFLKNKYLDVVLNFIISFSLVFLLFMIFDISKRSTNIFYDDLKINLSNVKKKVIWILLDEYDPSYIDNKFGLNLDYTKKIIDKSIIHNQTYAPSNATLYSAPSTLMKTQIKDLIFEDYKMKILDDENRKIDFSIENTIFNTLIEKNFSFSIYSEALPYCTMLRISKSNCEKNFNQLKFYFDGVINTLTPIKYISKIHDIFNERTDFNINQLNNIKIEKHKKIYLSKDLNIDTDNFAEIIKSNDNFFYFHLFLPHTNNLGHLVSSKHIRDEFNMNAQTDTEHYLMKLKYSDLLLEKIFNILEKEKEVLLLLTSDHWRRVDSPNNVKPSLFIAKIFGDSSKYQLNNSVSNIFIPNLIMSYLENEIETHEQLKIFLQNLPYYDYKKVHLM